MILKKIRLRNFRNFLELEFEAHAHFNQFIGENGQGKTNLLESIYCLGLVRSFRTAVDAELLKIGADSYEVQGEFLSELGVKHSVAIFYDGRRKSISFDKKRLNAHAALVGKIPMVLFSPEDHRLTGGGPAERRRFLDILLCQASQHYLKNLQEYTRILRQRNKLLGMVARGEAGIEELESWDYSIARPGLFLTRARINLLNHIHDAVCQTYAKISERQAKMDCRYHPRVEATSVGEDEYVRTLEQLRSKEVLREQTLAGPHLDDIRFYIDQKDVRKHASRGEQKSVLLSLKIVEYNYLYENNQSSPILLFDDVFSELDAARQENTLSLLTGLGQVFITSTSPTNLPATDAITFLVKNGTVEQATVEDT